MKTAVIYARYSSSNQTEQSIEGQLRVCQEYAKSHNILILDTYIDRAMTGTNDMRPDFRRMIKDSAKREWDYVLVYKLDRFSRNKYESAMHKKTLRDNGVKLLSATECIPETPEGIIVESLLEGMGQFYSEELSQKVRRGMNETRQKGNFTGGQLIYGYRVENKKIVIDEEKAEVVRYIYEQYSLDVTVEDIIADLSAKGVYNKGKPFARNTVYLMLKNEKYSGIYRHGEEVFENMYPQIVPKETFERVKEKVLSNRYGKRCTEVVYLLRNKAKCGYCGKSINAESGTARNGKVKRYYKCLGRKHNSGCQKAIVPREVLENMVLTTIIEEMSKPQVLDRIVSGLLAEQERQIKQNAILAMMLKEQKQIEASIENMLKAIEQGVVTNSTVKRLRELEEQQTELERKILVEQNRQTARISATEIRTYYKAALQHEANALIHYLVKEVVCYDDKIEIYFHTPIKTSPDENRGFFVSSKTMNKISVMIFIK